MLKILLVISVLVNVFLLFKVINNRRGADYITAILAEIRNSGFNRRINIGNRYVPLRKLSTELNTLMDRFQSTLEEKQRLEISHKQLISNISHDIRTPLTSLLGFVEVLQKNNNFSPAEQQEYLEIIHSKGQSLYKMIQDFFELSKLESEDTDIQITKTDLADKIKEVIASFYQDFVINKITPEIMLPDDPVYVWGNDTGLERILQNLISNAIKYGGDGGTIGISLREDKERVWVDIWDNGKGIPEKDIPFVFNRLYTTELSRNEKIRGSGLGLAIAKQLIEKQNGEIAVSSVSNFKTTFSFYLLRYQI